MGYSPFDFIGTDKRKRISSEASGIATDIVNEHKLREVIRKYINEFKKDKR